MSVFFTESAAQDSVKTVESVAILQVLAREEVDGDSQPYLQVSILLQLIERSFNRGNEDIAVAAYNRVIPGQALELFNYANASLAQPDTQFRRELMAKTTQRGRSAPG